MHEMTHHEFADRYWREAHPNCPVDNDVCIAWIGGHEESPCYIYTPTRRQWMRLTADQGHAFEQEAHDLWKHHDPHTHYAVLTRKIAERWWPENPDRGAVCGASEAAGA